MRFCIVDDDPNVVQMLSNIIEDKELGTVAGRANDGESAIELVKALQPDVALVDYLMPKRDGSSVVRTIRESHPGIRFILISQVTDKEMIAHSYLAGIEFFISKPINVIEVENVVRSVTDKIRMEKTIANIRGMLVPKGGSFDSEGARLNRIKLILGQIGVLGEKGFYDIMNICDYVLRHKLEHGPLDLNIICDRLEDNPKILKQRIRRAVYHGLANVANSGIEDYMNEHFIKFAGSLFDYESVRAEMDYIRGKRLEGGRVNINKFIEALLLQSDLE